MVQAPITSMAKDFLDGWAYRLDTSKTILIKIMIPYHYP
jgi:hypothetical protein